MKCEMYNLFVQSILPYFSDCIVKKMWYNVVVESKKERNSLWGNYLIA